jgi:hypothetical protein
MCFCCWIQLSLQTGKLQPPPSIWGRQVRLHQEIGSKMPPQQVFGRWTSFMGLILQVWFYKLVCPSLTIKLHYSCDTWCTSLPKHVEPSFGKNTQTNNIHFRWTKELVTYLLFPTTKRYWLIGWSKPRTSSNNISFVMTRKKCCVTWAYDNSVACSEQRRLN